MAEDTTEATEKKKGGFFRKLMKIAFIAAIWRRRRDLEAPQGARPRRRRVAGAAAARRRLARSDGS